MRGNADEIYMAGRAWRETNCPKTWKRVLVFVGRLAEVKNLPWLIERMQELPGTTGLVLVGDGTLGAELKSMVAAMELDGRVIFAGRKEGDDLYAVMSMADALILCSQSETFGAVVAEALQWGTPCVVSNNCGAAVLIENGKNGMVFSYGNASEFAEAVGRIPSRSTQSLLPVDLPSAVDRLVR
jgi:glycosyltransferase involved in cell wall biosynthesis